MAAWRIGRGALVLVSLLGSVVFLPLTAEQLPLAIDGWRDWLADATFASAPNFLLGLFLLLLLLGLVGPRLFLAWQQRERKTLLLSAEHAGQIMAAYEAEKRRQGQLTQRAIVDQLTERRPGAPMSLQEALAADAVARDRDAAQFSRWMTYGHELRERAAATTTRDELHEVCELIVKWINDVEKSLVERRPEFYGDFKRSSEIPWALQSNAKVADAMEKRLAVLADVVRDLRR